MPIFSSALDEAREAVENANIRAVKAAGVVEVLGNYEKYRYLTAGDPKTEAKAWKVDADVDAKSDITSLTVTPAEPADADSCEEQSGGGYKVTVYLKEADLTTH